MMVWLRYIRRKIFVMDWIKTNCHATKITLVPILGAVILWNCYFHITHDRVELPRYVDLQAYTLIQPDVFEDFPTDEAVTSKIQHNIHQTSPSSCIGIESVDYIKSFTKNNPDWNYYFWTDASARLLIERHYPDLLDIWDNVDKGVKRADIIRYVVLYEYGGIYADTDVENMKPLDRVTKKFYCIIPTEPFEHSALIYRRPFLINNAIMLCSKGHPFLRQLLDNLKYTAHKDVMSATGPFFISEQFIMYNRHTFNNGYKASALNFQSVLGTGIYDEEDSRAVYVPNTHYFTDNLDVASQSHVFVGVCRLFWFRYDIEQSGCIHIYNKGMHRKNTKFVYTKHHWHHSWCSNFWLTNYRKIFNTECVEINQIVPANQLKIFT